MNKLMALSLLAAASLMTVGCSYIGSSTDLNAVARAQGMQNITTGDGEFEDYMAVDHQKGTEIGLAVGIPFVGKLFEIFPARSNEALVGDMASRSKANGADAIINLDPPSDMYLGFPFVFVGVYVDQTQGTGIKLK